jgi:hypothetical protein
MRLFLDDDMADLAIEDLRTRRQWRLTNEILTFWEKKKNRFPITKRAIIRYALQCPDESAARFIAALRLTDADSVNDVEEILRFETSDRE